LIVDQYIDSHLEPWWSYCSNDTKPRGCILYWANPSI